MNSEGAGQWTNEPLRGAKGVEAAAQGQGAGVVPFSFAAASIPGPVPDLALAPASDSRVRVSYGEADARGLPVEAYLVEWTTASSFTRSSETWTLEVEAGPWGLADLQGRWSVSVGSFTTHPMGPLAPAHVVQEALERVVNAPRPSEPAEPAFRETPARRSVMTSVVIAHRLSTIQSASRIVFVENGSVRESGTHEELLKTRGAYAGLVRRQLEALSGSAASLAHGTE